MFNTLFQFQFYFQYLIFNLTKSLSQKFLCKPEFKLKIKEMAEHTLGLSSTRMTIKGGDEPWDITGIEGDVGQFDLNENKGFECSICLQKLSSYNALKRHENIHNKISYDCRICGKTFSTKFSLKTHCDNVHYTRANMKCSKCDKKFKTKALLFQHNKRVHDKVEQLCTKCCEIFKNKFYLTQHENDKHKDNNKMFDCNFCANTYVRYSAYQKHLMMNHQNVRLITSKPSDSQVVNNQVEISQNIFDEEPNKTELTFTVNDHICILDEPFGCEQQTFINLDATTECEFCQKNINSRDLESHKNNQHTFLMTDL